MFRQRFQNGAHIANRNFPPVKFCRFSCKSRVTTPGTRSLEFRHLPREYPTVAALPRGQTVQRRIGQSSGAMRVATTVLASTTVKPRICACSSGRFNPDGIKAKSWKSTVFSPGSVPAAVPGLIASQRPDRRPRRSSPLHQIRSARRL